MKRLLSMLLVVALLLSVPVVPVESLAAEENVTVVGELCPCGCGRESSQIQWKPWNVNVNGAPADGHYYLEADYDQKTQHTIMAGDRVVIDLRGKTLNTSGYGRLFLVYGYLAVMDTVGGGRMCSKAPGTANGGVVMVGMNETADPTFAFHSGTLTLDRDNKKGLAGGLVIVSGGCHFIQYGGTLYGGVATKSGGAIRGNADSDIQILGGKIIGCKSTEAGGAIATSGNLTLKNCVISGNEATGTAKGYGGNIYAEGGNLIIENATIEHGVANATTYGGGNIFALSGCKVQIKDSIIRNGYAALKGGNLYLGNGTQTLENVSVYGGSAIKGGANLFTNTAATTTTIIGGEIAGDVSYANGALILKGAAKIGANSGALKLASGTVIDASALTDGAEIYVDAEGTFTKNDANAAYFKPAFRTLLSTADGQLVGAQAASGAAGGYCPHCKQNVTWTAASGTLSGHCYLTADVTTGYTIAADAVLDLRGYNITAADRAFYVESGATLTLLDSVGGATVKGSGVEAEKGGVISNAGTLNIYGGAYVYVAGKTVSGGGVIYTESNTNIYGGVFDGSAFDNTVSGVYGAVLYMSSGTRNFTMTAGRMLGGKAYNGGCLCFGGKNKVNITGGSFAGGTAVYGGGNIRFMGGSDTGRVNAEISNVYVADGVATKSDGYGGNIFINYANVTLNDSVVLNGVCAAYGGSLSMGTHAYLTANDCFIANGSAPKGGNLYCASYLGSATFTDCVLTYGKSTSDNGGNIMNNLSNVKVYGGEISYGVAKKNGGNVYTNGGNYDNASAKDDAFGLYASEKGTPIITTGTAVNGGNFYSSGVVVMDAVFINNGKATTSGKDIYYSNGKTAYSLKVGSGLTGTVSMYVVSAAFDGTNIANTTAVEFPGKLILEGQMGEPALTVKDGKLMLGGIAVVSASGKIDWVVTMADALAASSANSYIQIFADQTVELTKDCVVDLNGNTLTVSGNYTLYGMDSSGDDYTVGTGKAILNGDAKTVLRTTVADGREYISIRDGNTVTYHRLGMKLTDVTLRTSNCGVYYKATWDCDSVLAAQIKNYGVALSLYKEPDAKFASDSQVRAVTYDGAELTNGEKRGEGVIINNVMKQNLSAAKNEERGQMPIYAKAYLTLQDGTQLLSEGASYSLKTAMQRLDNLIATDPAHFRRYTNDARAFYENWKECGMGNWNFKKLPTPEDDGVLEILMVGSSYCYYYVEELWGMLNAAGIKARVCNVYYSGCNLDQHYKWWINDESKYQFYVTDENGRKGTNNVGLEYCLAQGDWDFISLQQSNGPIRREGPAQHLENVALYTDSLISYFRQEFPKVEFLWHQTWAVQVGYDRDGTTMTSYEGQVASTAISREFAILLCEKYNARRVNSGEAWMNVRSTGYDNLCARLAINNGEGDYYHDGDIGGAQYLNACVWFETLTGLSCLDNTYRPVYTHNGKTYTLEEDFIRLLQESAHKAVVEKNNEI